MDSHQVQYCMSAMRCVASSIFKCTRHCRLCGKEREEETSGEEEKVQVIAKTSGLTIVIKVLFVFISIFFFLESRISYGIIKTFLYIKMSGHINI